MLTRVEAVRQMAARPRLHDYTEPGIVVDGCIVPPSPRLAPIVAGLARNAFVGDVVARQCMYRMPEPVPWLLVVNGARGARVLACGPRTRIEVDCLPPWTTSMSAALLHPGALGPLLGLPAALVADACIDIEDVLGERGRALREALEACRSADEQLVVLEHGLLDLARAAALPATPVSVEVARVLTRAPMRQRELERVSGWSERQLRRRFDHDLGLSPKRFLRLLRFNRVIDLLRAPRRRPWSELAATLGYSDQAHLIHEFRAFTGASPTAFLADPVSAQALRHGAVPRPRLRAVARATRGPATGPSVPA